MTAENDVATLRVVVEHHSRQRTTAYGQAARKLAQSAIVALRADQHEQDPPCPRAVAGDDVAKLAGSVSLVVGLDARGARLCESRGDDRVEGRMLHRATLCIHQAVGARGIDAGAQRAALASAHGELGDVSIAEQVSRADDVFDDGAAEARSSGDRRFHAAALAGELLAIG